MRKAVPRFISIRRSLEPKLDGQDLRAKHREFAPKFETPQGTRTTRAMPKEPATCSGYEFTLVPKGAAG